MSFDSGSTTSVLPSFEAAIGSIRDAVVITEPALGQPGPRILYVNPAFVEMTGYAADELVGRSPRLLQGDATDPALLARLRRELHENGCFFGESVNYRKDGTPFAVEWLITAIRGGTGEVTHWISAQRDITDRRGLELANQLLRAELQHRLHNALSVVQSFLRRTLAGTATHVQVRAKLEGRVEAFIRAQQCITHDRPAGIDLSSLVAQELAASQIPRSDRIVLAGEPFALRPRAAELLTMAVHELAINALAHGALADGQGNLAITWAVEDAGPVPTLTFEWRESGIYQPVPSAVVAGFGHDIVTQNLTYQLNATADWLLEAGTFACCIRVPCAACRLTPSA